LGSCQISWLGFVILDKPTQKFDRTAVEDYNPPGMKNERPWPPPPPPPPGERYGKGTPGSLLRRVGSTALAVGVGSVFAFGIVHGGGGSSGPEKSPGVVQPTGQPEGIKPPTGTVICDLTPDPKTGPPTEVNCHVPGWDPFKILSIDRRNEVVIQGNGVDTSLTTDHNKPIVVANYKGMRCVVAFTTHKSSGEPRIVTNATATC